MRFMVIVKATKESEGGALPDEKALAAMGNFNEELVKAGVMLAGEGLHPSSEGVRISFTGGKKTVTEGPFAETKELVAGYWLLQTKTRAEVRGVDQARAVHGRRGGRDSPGLRGGGIRRQRSDRQGARAGAAAA